MGRHLNAPKAPGTHSKWEPRANNRTLIFFILSFMVPTALKGKKRKHQFEASGSYLIDRSEVSIRVSLAQLSLFPGMAWKPPSVYGRKASRPAEIKMGKKSQTKPPSTQSSSTCLCFGLKCFRATVLHLGLSPRGSEAR